MGRQGPIADLLLFLRVRRAFLDGGYRTEMWKNLFSSGALKSKTVWVGVLQLLLPLVTSYVNGGVFAITDVLPVITGIGTILARAAATQPLAQK